jgi:hypothetical protein
LTQNSRDRLPDNSHKTVIPKRFFTGGFFRAFMTMAVEWEGVTLSARIRRFSEEMLNRDLSPREVVHCD